MKKTILISDHDSTYEVTISQPSVLRVRKCMEDSGINFDIDFDELPSRVQEKINDEVKDL
jgi:hypothetical protein